MKALVKSNVGVWFADRSPSLTNAVLLAMHLTEELAEALREDGQPMDGADKLRCALNAVETVAIEANDSGAISSDACARILHVLASGEQYVVPIIEAAIAASKHPEIVQAFDTLHAAVCCSPQLSRKKPKKRKAKK